MLGVIEFTSLSSSYNCSSPLSSFVGFFFQRDLCFLTVISVTHFVLKIDKDQDFLAVDSTVKDKSYYPGGTPRKIEWGCAARLPKPLPYL